MSNFQIAVLCIFGFFILVAVLIFSGLVPGLKSGSSSGDGGPVTLWGTIPSAQIAPLIEDFNRQYKQFVVTYVEKNPVSLDRDLVEALSRGTGPDLLMLPDTLIYRHADKVYIIPYATLSERAFKDAFIEEGELYLTGSGIIALPFRVDPLVMYYNRDILSGAGISLPPSSWEALRDMAPKIIKKDSSGNISQSVIAFGEYDNIASAKDIISLLIIQAGSPISGRTETGFKSELGSKIGSALRPADAALRYFTEFSNPVLPIYSWDRAFPNSKNSFLSGSLAFYLGHASEITGLRDKNPHLNFDVTKVPQARVTQGATLGDMDGLAIMKSSQNPAGAFEVASLMTGADFLAKLTQVTFLPPVRRDLLAQKPSDAYMSVFYDSALMSKGWIDPSPSDTNSVFKELVGNITSGRMQIGDAVMNADAELNRLFGGI